MLDSGEKNSGYRTKWYTANANIARPAKDETVSSSITDLDCLHVVEATRQSDGEEESVSSRALSCRE